MELHDIGIRSDGMNKVCLFATESRLDVGDLEASRGVYPFTSIVTYGGRPSDYPVGGTEGLKGGPYRVLIPSTLLDLNIPDLKGKGVFALSSLKEHSNAPVIVGEFFQSWVEYDDIPTAPGVLAVAKASGLLYHRRGPELVERIVEEARAHKMGLSYDLKEVEWFLGKAQDSTEEIMQLTNFKWRGATILYRDSAAYRFTQLAARRVEATQSKQGDQDMDWSEIEDRMSKLLERTFGEMKRTVMNPLDSRVEDLEAQNKELKKSLDEFKDEIKTTLEKKEEPPPEPPPPKDETSPTKVSVADFTAAIGEAVARASELSTAKTLETLAEMAESMKKLATATPPSEKESHERKTISAASLAFVNKYNQDSKDVDDVTLEDIKAAIQTVKETVKSKSERTRALEILSAARREMVKKGGEK